MVNHHTKAIATAVDKTVSMSLRVSPTIKVLLEIAAERENRSQINLLETLVFVHGEQHKLSVPPTKIGQGKGAKK